MTGTLFLFAEQAPGSSEHMVAIFLIEVMLMLLVGRLLGELMQRIGQPEVMGQLIAGIIIGPSVFGAVAPELYKLTFPDVAAQKKMIDAISQIGILMLLVLTGIETDLKLVNKVRNTAFFTSLAGIVFPFACGYAVGEFLPAAMIPDPTKRFVTSLFLATALSISSVKIVAMVIMEVGFLRRNVGQIILASAILDDTIGWIIIAVIGGLAAGGQIDVTGVAGAFGGTIAFLAVSFLLGRRAVAFLIRWVNDNLAIEMPVITVILILMIGMALITNWIGVHTVLGAFVVGILVGESPILTRQIEGQLRGLIVGFFAPVFFTVAGREIDLTVLESGNQVMYALAFIGIASIGKIVGCYVGSLLGRLDHRSGLAVAIGMNARGSTEVIVATIGLSLGVLNRDLFTLIVIMAIVTTLVTPPLLRWALLRIPPTGEEKKRLAREEAEAAEFLTNVERLLVTADDSQNGHLASLLAGRLAGAMGIVTTVVEASRHKKKELKIKPGEIVREQAEATVTGNLGNEHVPDTAPTVVVNEAEKGEVVTTALDTAEKGFDVMCVGLKGAMESMEKGGTDILGEILTGYEGSLVMIALSKGKELKEKNLENLRVLLPTTGADYSMRAAEVAVALAKASTNGNVTAFHVEPRLSDIDVLRHPDEVRSAGRRLIKEVEKLGKRQNVKVIPCRRTTADQNKAMLKEARSGNYDLVVMGVKMRPGESVFFGRSAAAIADRSPISILFVNS
ncbi:MAG TPA: cation:proton antiporter [Pyrinomonadaceae bacterium]|nr:cation:proton antiporter [Pyrinomonadaceae bacterium]